MSGLLLHWPWAIVGQALGVALALNIDAILWTWRRFEIAVFASNWLGGFYLLAVVLSQASLPWLLLPMNAEKTLIPPLLWLLLVTCVQSHQLKIGLRAAFFAALMNFLVFGAALHFISLFFIFVFAVVNTAAIFLFQVDVTAQFGVFGVFWIGSAIVTHALLALFRPSIRGMWRAWRQNSEKT